MTNILLEKSVDFVLGIRTRGRRMVGLTIPPSYDGRHRTIWLCLISPGQTECVQDTIRNDRNGQKTMKIIFLCNSSFYPRRDFLETSFLTSIQFFWSTPVTTITMAGKWLWFSWKSSRFLLQRSAVQIESISYNLYWIFTVKWIVKTKIGKKRSKMVHFLEE